jgi:hypothetical protein
MGYLEYVFRNSLNQFRDFYHGTNMGAGSPQAIVCWLVCEMLQGNGIKDQFSFRLDSEILASIYLLKKPLVTRRVWEFK